MTIFCSGEEENTGSCIRADVRLKIMGSHDVRMISFRNLSDPSEHVALIFDGNERDDVPLVRLHSQCLTGDVFHSLRCDCRGQLQEAIDRMSECGGIILYLIQEGRGIGLYNKLDAYQLQINEGMDTYDANEHIGQPADCRNYEVASEMLMALGIPNITLLSNNPDKEAQLIKHGINVVERVPTGVHLTDENFKYLKAKKDKTGHEIELVSDCCSDHE